MYSSGEPPSLLAVAFTRPSTIVLLSAGALVAGAIGVLAYFLIDRLWGSSGGPAPFNLFCIALGIAFVVAGAWGVFSVTRLPEGEISWALHRRKTVLAGALLGIVAFLIVSFLGTILFFVTLAFLIMLGVVGGGGEG